MESTLAQGGDLSPVLRQTTSIGARVAGLRITNYAVGFVASVLIARAVGPTGRGLYAFPLAILGIIMAVGHVGLEQANVFLASQNVGLRRLWSNAAVVGATIGIVVWAVIAVLYGALGRAAFGGLPFIWIAVPVLQVPFLLQSLYWANILQLDGRLVAAVRAALIGVAVHVAITGGLFVAHALTPFRVLLLAWSVNGTAWAILLRTSARAGLVGARPDWPAARRALAFGLKAHLGLIFVFLLLRVDQLMVKGYLGYRALGLYALATTIAELLWLLTDPLAAALLPQQVRAADVDGRRLGYATARMSMIVAVVAGGGAWIAAPYAIRIVYGASFAGSVLPFRLLLPGVVALAIQRPLGALVVKDGRAWLVSLIGMSGLALNVVINVLLLPRMGIAGASIASTACYSLVALAYVAATRRRGAVSWGDMRPRVDDLRLLGSLIRAGDGS